MTAHYYTYKQQGKKVHMMEISNSTCNRGATTKQFFETAKEAKAYAKQIGAQAWNY